LFLYAIVKDLKACGLAGQARPLAAAMIIKGSKMTDAVMLAMGLGFFLVALAYVSACDRL
jgi:hypothetical protein